MQNSQAVFGMQGAQLGGVSFGSSAQLNSIHLRLGSVLLGKLRRKPPVESQVCGVQQLEALNMDSDCVA